MAIRFDSQRSALLEVTLPDGEAVKLRVHYRGMTAREHASLRATYAAIAAKAEATTANAADIAALSDSEEEIMSLGRSLIRGIEDEAGEPVLFDGVRWENLEPDARREACVSIADLVRDVLKMAGKSVSTRLLGK